MSLVTSFLGRAIMVAAAFAFLLVAPVAFAHSREGGDTNKPRVARAEDAAKAKLVRPAQLRASVAIGAGGGVHLHKAKVTAVSGNTITAVSQWGAASMTWSILTNASTTRFSSEGSGQTSIASIAVNDLISVQGKLSTTTAALTVQAKVVKEHRQ